jgi:hypothetical protein
MYWSEGVVEVHRLREPGLLLNGPGVWLITKIH